MVPITMPKWGLTLEEATVAQWVKAPGDAVLAGETVVLVETDKASGEVEAPCAGRLAAILTPSGQVVHPGDVLGEIDPTGPEPQGLLL